MSSSKNSIYDKELLQAEAIRSSENSKISEKLGEFILELSDFIARSHFKMDEHRELKQTLIDSAVLRVCEEFLERFNPEFQGGSSAATLIYSLVISEMRNRMKAREWKDEYGTNSKSFVSIIDAEGKRKSVLMKTFKDDTISELISNARPQNF
jgi:hypothetical protein|tara:strand:+ start:40 stop:498 length:459 start_codon:yes stop_codon:yes gene_type:complete